MLNFLRILILGSLISCTPKGIIQKDHRILESQRLVLRGHFLSNKICLKYSREECLEWSEEDQDLRDPATREMLDSMGFVCRILKKRYYICPDRVGFCRNHYKAREYKSTESLDGALVECFSD